MIRTLVEKETVINKAFSKCIGQLYRVEVW